jgi:hypothetical protein
MRLVNKRFFKVVLTILSRFDLKIEETISNILNQRSEKQVTIVIQCCHRR